MSSSLIRSDLIPIVSGYVLLMGALAIGLWLSRRPPRPDRAKPGWSLRRAHLPPVPERWQHGWPRLLRHLAGTAVGGYLLLMAIVVLYYYGVAHVAGSFLDSAVSGCALLIGLCLPIFVAASWLTERRARRAREAADQDHHAPADR